MVKLLVDGQEHKFTTTIFPDGTSQVWKLDLAPEEGDEIEILWLFENEAELFHVCQLAHLLEEEYDYSPTLIVPYLPYGRQDKDVTNVSSFALNTFKDILYHRGICRIETFDAHSSSDMIYSTAPDKFHKSIFNHDVVCFPDKGAAVRYGTADAFGNAPIIHCEKIRNQATGEITGLKVVGATPDLLFNKRILIVDDICDGGMTFIKVAEALKTFNPLQIDLAVSHGIFSKGKRVLTDAGITNVFTTNSLLRNPEGFKIC
jgi:ribose-phosphate pyrophosphokinase